MNYSLNQEKKDDYESVYRISFNEVIPDLEEVTKLETIQHLISTCTNFYFHPDKKNQNDLLLTLYHNKLLTFHYN